MSVSERLNNKMQHDVTNVKPARYWVSCCPYTQNIADRPLKLRQSRTEAVPARSSRLNFYSHSFHHGLQVFSSYAQARMDIKIMQQYN
ncbi:hypothetical protein E2C01_097551 [Portunus trituberculatus]|uniref:Uncharacterized protein n=1 Tax=Portunus trituberculatus TaxID=210409 RepID=A0A5B7K5Z1_PORTR|nr:hypothetical protein [Portunus trituberculatus]